MGAGEREGILAAALTRRRRDAQWRYPYWSNRSPQTAFARSGEPLALAAEGATRVEALQRLQELMKDSVVGGRLLVPLQVPASDNPWLRMHGIFRDDPLFDEWQAAIAEYRRQGEEDPDAL